MAALIPSLLLSFLDAIRDIKSVKKQVYAYYSLFVPGISISVRTFSLLSELLYPFEGTNSCATNKSVDLP